MSPLFKKIVCINTIVFGFMWAAYCIIGYFFIMLPVMPSSVPALTKYLYGVGAVALSLVGVFISVITIIRMRKKSPAENDSKSMTKVHKPTKESVTKEAVTLENEYIQEEKPKNETVKKEVIDKTELIKLLKEYDSAEDKKKFIDSLCNNNELYKIRTDKEEMPVQTLIGNFESIIIFESSSKADIDYAREKGVWQTTGSDYKLNVGTRVFIKDTTSGCLFDLGKISMKPALEKAEIKQ